MFKSYTDRVFSKFYLFSRRKILVLTFTLYPFVRVSTPQTEKITSLCPPFRMPYSGLNRLMSFWSILRWRGQVRPFWVNLTFIPILGLNRWFLRGLYFSDLDTRPPLPSSYPGDYPTYRSTSTDRPSTWTPDVFPTMILFMWSFPPHTNHLGRLTWFFPSSTTVLSPPEDPPS